MYAVANKDLMRVTFAEYASIGKSTLTLLDDSTDAFVE